MSMACASWITLIGPLSDRDLLAILGVLYVETLHAGEHVIAHVGYHEPVTSQLGPMARQGLVVEVVPDRLVEEVGFANEEVSAVRNRAQRIRPFGVARIGDRLPCTIDTDRIRGGAAGVDDLLRRDNQRSKVGGH